MSNDNINFTKLFLCVCVCVDDVMEDFFKSFLVESRVSLCEIVSKLIIYTQSLLPFTDSILTFSLSYFLNEEPETCRVYKSSVYNLVLLHLETFLSIFTKQLS